MESLLSVYLDTSVVVPLFVPDTFNHRARQFLAAAGSPVVVSDFVAAEFASALGIRIRTRATPETEARRALANFDSWIPGNTVGAETLPVDVRMAEAALRRLDLPLRTPDAVNLAIAQRLGADLATFDIRMADCARAFGMAVVAL
jgi:predicted nucleic acid-binding protein